LKSLVKRLQADPTTIGLPWRSPRNVNAGWLVNEFVLGGNCGEKSRGVMNRFDLHLQQCAESAHRLRLWNA
jgi:hypothetical protein